MHTLPLFHASLNRFDFLLFYLNLRVLVRFFCFWENVRFENCSNQNWNFSTATAMWWPNWENPKMVWIEKFNRPKNCSSSFKLGVCYRVFILILTFFFRNAVSEVSSAQAVRHPWHTHVQDAAQEARCRADACLRIAQGCSGLVSTFIFFKK